MTVGELVKSGLVKDSHRICINMKIGTSKRGMVQGNWFQDHILKYMDWKIESMTFDYGYLWTVNANAENEEDNEIDF